MSKIVRPFGELAKEIYIKADVHGLIMIEARNIVPAFKMKGHVPSQNGSTSVPMDVREMVLALIKIVQDYSVVLFASMGERPVGAMKSNGETNTNNDNPGQSG